MKDEYFNPEKYTDFMFMLDYIGEECWDEMAWNHMLCLWTAYCLHWNLYVGTEEYESEIQEIYQALKGNEDCDVDDRAWYGICVTTPNATPYDIFKLYMSKYLR